MVEEQKTTEIKKIQEQRFEFVLYINQNRFIVQRFFDVRDYNENVLNSLEMKELMDNIAGMNNGDWGSLGIIPKFLKDKSINYLWENYNPYVVQLEEDIRPNTDKIDNFQFEIKVDKITVAKSEFSGNVFPPKIRYDVNIKEIIPSIISEIRRFFSQKKYTIIDA